MESLAAVLFDNTAAVGSDAAVPSIAHRPPAPPPAAEAAYEPPAPRAQAADPVALHTEQREIVVVPAAERVLRDLQFVLTHDKFGAEQEADKVLRDLQFVLTGDKVRLGTYGTRQTQETIVATHADKVLATLEDISSARRASEGARARSGAGRHRPRAADAGRASGRTGVRAAGAGRRSRGPARDGAGSDAVGG